MVASTSAELRVDGGLTTYRDSVDNKTVFQDMEQAVRILLRGVGEDISREGLIDTPRVRHGY